MSKLKKRKDGRYQKNIKIGSSDNGKLQYKTVYGKTIAETERKAADIISDINKGIIITDNNITLKEWSLKWLEVYKSNAEYNTHRMYNNCVDLHIITSHIADVPIRKIKKSDLQLIINKKVEEGLTRSVVILVRTLKQIFRQAEDEEIIYKNPAKNIKAPTFEKKIKRTVTKIEEDAIKNTQLPLKEKVFLYLGMYTGLRRGEILALTQNDIDIKNSKIKISKTIVFKENSPTLKPQPKTDSGRRTIPIIEPLRSLLREYLLECEQVYLFTMKSDKLMSKSSYNKMLKRIMNCLNDYADEKNPKEKKLIRKEDEKRTRENSLVNFTPHILRHTYATNLYKAGIDIKTAQKLLGHKDIKVTLEIYTHTTIDNNETKEKLEQYLENKI